MNALITFISAVAPLSAQGRAALVEAMKCREYPKGQVLVRAGSVCDYLYFIEKGLVRTYYLKDDREVTDCLYLENSFAGSLISFVTRKPDNRIVETLEPSVLWTLHHEELDDLLGRFPELERWGRTVAVNGMMQIQERLNSLHFSTALERYQALIEHKPALLQRVPLSIIASYLGMTQETLSRIRSQIKIG